MEAYKCYQLYDNSIVLVQKKLVPPMYRSWQFNTGLSHLYFFYFYPFQNCLSVWFVLYFKVAHNGLAVCFCCRFRAISYPVTQKLKRATPLNNLLNWHFFIPHVPAGILFHYLQFIICTSSSC